MSNVSLVVFTEIVHESCIVIVALLQGNPDMNSDFRLKEMPGGTVLFESVVCAGSFVGIQGSNGLQTNLNVFLVVCLCS